MTPLDKKPIVIIGKCKAIAIQTDFGTFRHNQAYSKSYIQSRGISRTLAYSKPETYSEPRYIENSGIFGTQGLFRHLQCQTSPMKPFVKTVNGKQFRNISLPRSLLHEINIMRQLLQLFCVKKTMVHVGAGDCEILINY